MFDNYHNPDEKISKEEKELLSIVSKILRIVLKKVRVAKTYKNLHEAEELFASLQNCSSAKQFHNLFAEIQKND